MREEFIADVSNFVDNLEIAIQSARDFAEAIHADIAALAEFQAALDSLPLEKTVTIRYDTQGTPEAMAGTAGDTAGWDAQEEAMRAAQEAARDFDEAATEAGVASEDGAIRGQAAWDVLDEIIRQGGESLGRFSDEADAAGAEAARAAQDAASSYDAQAEALKAARDAADAATAASARASAGDQAETDLLRNLTAWKIAVAKAQLAVNQAYDEASAGQIAYLALSRDVEQSALQDAVQMGVAGEAARNYSDDAAAAASYLAQFEIKAADAERAADDVAHSSASAADGLARAGNAARDTGNAAAGAAGGWGILNRNVTLFGGALGGGALGTVRAWHIALDAAFESVIALGGALAALTAGMAAMAPAAQDIYNHLVAVHDVSTALGQTIRPLNGWFENLQHQMAPQTIEAYGGALNLLDGQMGGLAPIVKEVVSGIDDWIARLDLFASHQHSLDGILQSGVGFLSQFRVIVDDVGVALGNLIKDDPGTAHFLLDLVEGASKALDVITSLPGPIVMAGLAIHSFWLWGGLLATGVTGLLGPLRSLSLAMGGVAAEETAVQGLSKDASGLAALKATVTDVGAGFAALGGNIAAWAGGMRIAYAEAEDGEKVTAALAAGTQGLSAAYATLSARLYAIGTSPWTWAVVAAAAIADIVYETGRASAGVTNYINAQNQALSQMSATQAFGQIGTDITQLQDKIAAVRPQDYAAGWSDLSNTMNSFGKDANAVGADFSRSWGELTGGHIISGLAALARGIQGVFIPGQGQAIQAKDDIAAYQNQVKSLIGSYGNMATATEPLIRQGYTFTQALSAEALAGVKSSDSLAMINQKVKNLMTGYENLSVSGGALQNSVNAVTFATEQQNSKISALQQGWQAFISTVTGGESSFTAFGQDMQSLATAGQAAGASMRGLNANSLSLRSSFTQAITQASTLYNSLQSMASAAGLGAKGTQMLTQAGKDMVAQLLPMAKGSQAATAQLYALAQQAGYQGVDSFKALAQWVGNAHSPMQNLDSITTQLTQDSANLARDVNNLADAINSNLNSAMAAAKFQADGGQQAFNNFAAALNNSHESSQGLHSAAQSLAAELISLYGNTSTAHAEFDAFAQSMGLSRSQADSLWNSIEGGAARASSSVGASTSAIRADIASLPTSKTITIDTYYVTTGNAGGGPTGATVHTGTGMTGMATGGRVPGWGGGDIVPAMLEPGEAIVPKHLVPDVAPFLATHRVPGFAEGGHVRPHHRAPWTMGDVISLWAREIWADDLRGHGRGHPLSVSAIEALVNATKPRGGQNALYRDLESQLRHEMLPYEAKDLTYWKVAGERHALSEAEAAAIRHLEQAIRVADRHHDWGLAERYMTQLHATERTDARRFRQYTAELSALYREGFAAGGLVLPAGSYDSGGYLPVGLSMAYNGTGKPEPVGAAVASEVHVHLHGDLADDSLWDRMQVKTLDYGYRNTGKPTGKVIPGP